MESLNATKIVLDSPNVVCSKCGSKLFESVYALKRVSSLYTGTGKEQLQPIPLFRCADCHAIVDDYLDSKNAKYVFGENKDASAEKKESSILI